MSTETYDYPEDEFDVAGRERGPQGVHRSPRPLWRALLPLLAVVVLAPLLAWGAVSWLGGSNANEDPEPAATAEQTTAPADTGAATEAPAEPTSEAAPAEPTAETTSEATEEPTEEPTTEAAVDRSATIAVLNGAGVTGLAGDVAGTLQAEGFTSTVPDNYGGGPPASTTLYYNSAELRATAEEVGRVLGIGNLVESASATQSIAIVLRQDFGG